MSRFTTSDGLSLYYEETGDGLPVLCLAGLTRTSRDFDYVAPHLPGVRLIRLDYRGRGHSDWAPDPASYTVEVEARDVFELLQHLRLAQVAVLGTSRGGFNAMAMAVAAPDTLLGVALNDVGPELDPVGLNLILTYLGRQPASQSFEEAAAALEKVMIGFDAVPDGRWLSEARNNFRARPGQGLDLSYDPTLREPVAAMAAEALPDLWPLYDVLPDRPLALIWGENSALLKAQTVDEMQRRRPDMILARVPGRGHPPFLDEPESLAALHTWLEAMQ